MIVNVTSGVAVTFLLEGKTRTFGHIQKAAHLMLLTEFVYQILEGKGAKDDG